MEETKRLSLNLSSEPLPHNGVHTPDSGPHRVEAETIYFRDPLHRDRGNYAIAVANSSPEYFFRLAPIYPQGIGEPWRDFEFDIGLLAPLGMRPIRVDDPMFHRHHESFTIDGQDHGEKWKTGLESRWLRRYLRIPALRNGEDQCS